MTVIHTLKGLLYIGIICQITLNDLNVVFPQIGNKVLLVVDGRGRSEDGYSLEGLPGFSEGRGDVLADGPAGSDDEDRGDASARRRGGSHHGLDRMQAGQADLRQQTADRQQTGDEVGQKTSEGVPASSPTILVANIPYIQHHQLFERVQLAEMPFSSAPTRSLCVEDGQ